MCQNQTLYHNENIGYVIRCSKCDRFQIGYGSILLNLEAVDFESFCNKISEIRQKHHPLKDKYIKTMMIPTPYTGLQLFLSQRELYELYEMLETADNELKSEQLIKLFYNEV
jgi:hypothetical protein